MSVEQGKDLLKDRGSAAKYFKCWAECHVFAVNTEQLPGKHTVNYH